MKYSSKERIQNKHSKETPFNQESLSVNSSGNLEVDFVVRNAFANVNAIENKYQSANPPQYNSLKQRQQRATSPNNQVQDRRKGEDSHLKQEKSPQLIKQTLTALFGEICTDLDFAQSQCVQMIAQKQNEIFQISQKHKVQSAFRNETLGIWYDAKSQIAQCFEDIKDKMFYQQNQAESALGISYINQNDYSSIKENQNIQRFKSELAQFELFSTKSMQKIENMQDSFDQMDAAIMEDKQKLAQIISELQEQKKTSIIQNERLLSPFQKKLQSGGELSVLSGQKSRQTSNSRQVSASKSSRTLKPIEKLKQMFENIQESESQQQQLKSDLFTIIQSVLQQNCSYIQNLKPLATRPKEDKKLNELVYNNEQLYSELCLSQDKFADLQVENTKLREQFQKKPDDQFKKISFELCSLVTQFMHAMRQLQKAVNRKVPDVSEQKSDFESAKNNLTTMVQQLKEHITIPENQRSPSRDKQKPTVSSSQLQKLPALLQNVKNLQLEKQKLQELITELKQVHQMELDKSQQKLIQQKEGLQKLAAQTQSLLIKQSYNDLFLTELKQSVIKQPVLFDIVTKLDHHYTQKAQQEIQKQPLKLDPQITALKQELQKQIQSINLNLQQQVIELQNQLGKKEDSLQKLKLLFIQKLHELENSFVDITQTVEEVDYQQQAQSIQQQKRETSHMEQAVETVLAKFEISDREHEIDQLVQANQQLEMKLSTVQQKDTREQDVKFEYVAELQEQLNTLKQELEKNLIIKKEQENQDVILKNEIKGLRYDNKKYQMDLKDWKDKFEKMKSEYQVQFNALKQATVQKNAAFEKESQERQQIESSYNKLKKEFNLAAKAFEELDNQKVQAEKDFEQSQLQLEETSQQLQQYQLELQDKSEELDSVKIELQQTLDDYERQFQQQSELEKFAQTEEELTEANQQITKQKEEISRLNKTQIEQEEYTHQLEQQVVEISKELDVCQKEPDDLYVESLKKGQFEHSFKVLNVTQQLYFDLYQKQTELEQKEKQLEHWLKQKDKLFEELEIKVVKDKQKVEEQHQKEIENLQHQLSTKDKFAITLSTDQQRSKEQFTKMQIQVQRLLEQSEQKEQQISQTETVVLQKEQLITETKTIVYNQEVQIEQLTNSTQKLSSQLDSTKQFLQQQKQQSKLILCLHSKVREIFLKKLQQVASDNIVSLNLVKQEEKKSKLLICLHSKVRQIFEMKIESCQKDCISSTDLSNQFKQTIQSLKSDLDNQNQQYSLKSRKLEEKLQSLTERGVLEKNLLLAGQAKKEAELSQKTIELENLRIKQTEDQKANQQNKQELELQYNTVKAYCDEQSHAIIHLNNQIKNKDESLAHQNEKLRTFESDRKQLEQQLKVCQESSDQFQKDKIKITNLNKELIQKQIHTQMTFQKQNEESQNQIQLLQNQIQAHSQGSSQEIIILQNQNAQLNTQLTQQRESSQKSVAQLKTEFNNTQNKLNENFSQSHEKQKSEYDQKLKQKSELSLQLEKSLNLQIDEQNFVIQKLKTQINNDYFIFDQHKKDFEAKNKEMDDELQNKIQQVNDLIEKVKTLKDKINTQDINSQKQCEETISLQIILQQTTDSLNQIQLQNSSLQQSLVDKQSELQNQIEITQKLEQSFNLKTDKQEQEHQKLQLQFELEKSRFQKELEDQLNNQELQHQLKFEKFEEELKDKLTVSLDEQKKDKQIELLMEQLKFMENEQQQTEEKLNQSLEELQTTRNINDQEISRQLELVKTMTSQDNQEQKLFLQQHNEEVNELNQKLIKSEAKLKSLNDNHTSIQTDLQQRLTSLQQTMSQMEKQLNVVKTQKEQDSNDLKLKLESEQQKVISQQQQIQSLQDSEACLQQKQKLLSESVALKELERIKIFEQYINSNKEVKLLQKDLDDKKKELQNIIDKSQESQYSFIKLSSEYQTTIKESELTHKDQINELQNSIQELQSQIKSNETEIAQANLVVDNLKQNILAEQLSNQKLQSSINELENQLGSKQNETKWNKQLKLAFALQEHLKKCLHDQLNSKIYEIENLNIYTQNQEQQIQNADFKQIQIEGQLQSAREKTEALKRDIKQLQKDKEELITALNQEQQINETVNDQLQQVQNDHVTHLKILAEKEQELENALASSNPDVKLALNQAKKFTDDVQQQQQETISQLKLENQQLKELTRPSEGRNSWGSDGGHGRGSWGSGGGINAEVEETLKHIRAIMSQFLQKLPIVAKETEDVLSIALNMLHFPEAELKTMIIARENLSKKQEAEMKQKAKGGISGFFKGNKK